MFSSLVSRRLFYLFFLFTVTLTISNIITLSHFFIFARRLKFFALFCFQWHPHILIHRFFASFNFPVTGSRVNRSFSANVKVKSLPLSISVSSRPLKSTTKPSENTSFAVIVFLSFSLSLSDLWQFSS